MNFDVEKLQPEDWPQVREIYIEGIESGNATFETEAPAWEAWDSSHRVDSRFVALSPLSDRCVYGGVAEVSVYVARQEAGRGVGTALLEMLVQGSEEAGLWTLQAGIFPENEASQRLHEKLGFRRIGYRGDQRCLARRNPTGAAQQDGRDVAAGHLAISLRTIPKSQQSSHPVSSPRIPSMPSRMSHGTMMRAAAGSAHHQPATALAASPTKSASER